jgi:hypothetical protein
MYGRDGNLQIHRVFVLSLFTFIPGSDPHKGLMLHETAAQ